MTYCKTEKQRQKDHFAEIWCRKNIIIIKSTSSSLILLYYYNKSTTTTTNTIITVKCMDLPMVLNTLRTVIVRNMPAERSLSAITGKTTVAAHRPTNGRAEKKPF